MEASEIYIMPTLRAYTELAAPAGASTPLAPRRSAPFNDEPGFHEPAGVWLYGNAKLLCGEVAHVPEALHRGQHDPAELDRLESIAEKLVLDGNVIVTGIHNPAHRRVALIPLRWAAPRILVLSGGFKYHLGNDLKQEPFRAARLWRYAFDCGCDLVISRRAPDKLPTYALRNPTIDRMVERIAKHEWPGLRWIMGAIPRVLV